MRAYLDETERCIVVQFLPVPCGKEEVRQMECVVDLNQYGDVIGIEIINLAYKAGKNIFEGFDFAQFQKEVKVKKCSYDPKADAFFIYFPNEPNELSVYNRVVPCKIKTDQEGRLCQIEIDLTEIRSDAR